MNKKYKIFCSQRGTYFADGEKFDTLHEVRDQLISYHSIDNDEDSLNSQNLADIVDGFEWEVHDLKGNVIDLKELELIK